MSMPNIDKPIPIYQIALILIFFAAMLVVSAEVVSYHTYNPVVLNSLPRSVIKCSPGAIEGLCANGEYAKNWEAMQK